MQLKKFLFYPLIFLKCGTLKPKVMRIPVSNHEIFLNPSDERAFKKIVIDFIRQRESTPMRFWRDHLNHLNRLSHLERPLCLDIGSNYGECFATGDYSGTECLVIEANPELIKYLEQTKSRHEDSASIRIVNVLVSDKSNKNVPFHYSKKWTGGGSAVVKSSDSVTINVESKSLCEIVDENISKGYKDILFKADIEGYEGLALTPFIEEMSEKEIAGILEFDTLMLKSAGTDPKEFFSFLLKHFEVFLTYRRSTKILKLNTWDDLGAQFGRHEFHCDLVVYSSRSLMPETWTIAAA